MFNFLTRLFSNNNNPEPSDKESFFSFELKGRVNEKLIPTLIPWVLGVSVTGATIYGVSNVLPKPSVEAPGDLTPVTLEHTADRQKTQKPKLQ